MSVAPRHIRVFISSPGDVAEERSLALQVIDQLPHRAVFRDRVTLQPVAWDNPGTGTPMLATMPPQEAINQGLTKPSECDIVVVIFWARMGTQLSEAYKKPDGSHYWSGTEWEFWDAFNASTASSKPLLVVYRRTEKVLLDDEAPDYEQRLEQKRRVKTFFDSFVNTDSSIKQGYNLYEKPDDFRKQFESHLETLVLRLLNEPETLLKQTLPTPSVEIWQGSPFPGLHAFTPSDAPIFFGRGRETDELVEQVRKSRFVAVVGASGSGKSSLVGAGLIPRLKANAISGSKDWYILNFTPSDNPFEVLSEKLLKGIAALIGDPVEYSDRKHKLTQNLREYPSSLAEICELALENVPAWAEVLLFIDQFEELFTLAPEETRIPFTTMLAQESTKLRVVVTLRADFYHRCVEYPDLAEKLRIGSFPLAVPGERALYEMITRPVDRAALTYADDDLPEQILADTGNEPGNLALMAYALDELYKLAENQGDRQLTRAGYEMLGGVQGAIGIRAESVYGEIPLSDERKDAAMHRVFRELVELTEEEDRIIATRRRIPPDRFATDSDANILVEYFTTARLLTADRQTIEVAHEALFTRWTTLVSWILQVQDDLRLLRQFERDARDWKRRGKSPEVQPPNEQLKPLLTAAKHLQVEITDPLLMEYTDLDTKRLLNELKESNPSHQRRLFISERLGFLGDPRPGVGVKNVSRNEQVEIIIPEIIWCYVEAMPRKDSFPKPDYPASVEIESQKFPVNTFFIAKYLITNQQFQAFLDDPEGYSNPDWWQEMPSEYRQHEHIPSQRQFPNSPRETVTWYQAVAFTNWLTARCSGQILEAPAGINSSPLIIGDNARIQLPTEWEWQWVAQGGFEAREYPWEGTWDSQRANTFEARLGETTVVGMYPDGAAACGALDMAGNVWEWCLNEYKTLAVVMDSTAARCVRGGSFGSGASNARCAARGDHEPFHGYNGFLGFRVVCSYS